MTATPVEGTHPPAAYSAATLKLAEKESAEHMKGMSEVYEEMRHRPLQVKAYRLTDPAAPPLSSSSSSSDNVKIIHFVRHGQGFHNLMADLAHQQGRTWVQFSQTPDNPYVMPEILDAPLTEMGRQQAYLLQSYVHSMNDDEEKPELVVLSPNCRALQTGIIVFASLLGHVPFLAHEMVREETGVHRCDQRRPVSRQSVEFPQVDFSLISSEDDPIFHETTRETKRQVGDRIYEFLEWLSQRPEKRFGISSHSGWLLTLFNGVCETEDDSLKTWWQTGEMRSVKLQFVQNDTACG